MGQIVCGCNKMDCDTAGYKQARYEEVSNEMKSMLVKVGWKKDMVEKQVPFLPISGWMGDNLLKPEDATGKCNMPWWTGIEVENNGEKIMVYKKDTTLGQTKEFDAQIQVLDIPNEIKVGYSPIGFVRCGRSACRIAKLKWKMGKETGGKKM